jgi:hypothetical protein
MCGGLPFVGRTIDAEFELNGEVDPIATATCVTLLLP